MNLFDRLKNLKLIEPDAEFSERSKRDIMASPPVLPFHKLSVRQILFRLLEAGVAGALVALFILVITGGTANSPLVPAPFAAIDPAALHAEAQAINIQIKLTDMAYEAVEATGTSAESTATGVPAIPAAAGVSTASTSTAQAATSTASSTTIVSVDQALKALSQ